MADVLPGQDTPVETPVAAQEATPAPESTAEQVAEVPQPEATPEKMLPQSEVNKLIAKEKAQAEKRALRIARAEAEAAFYKQQYEARTAQPESKVPGRPKQEDFAGRPFDEYLDAVTDWKLEQRLAKQREESQQQQSVQTERQRVAEQAQMVRQKLEPGMQKYPDFEDVALAEDVPNTPVMAMAMARLDNAPDVAYHLGLHHEEALKIARLPDIEQAWAIKELSQKLKAPPKPTQTPPPIVPTSGKAPVEKRLQDASVDEFFEIRARQLAAKRGRR